ncbi:MAG: DEAD/DEAH box helicase [Nitrospirae bacterium]|nr:DEAD/DEAH box helicase [Nitrospirota bacterium]
MKFSELNLPSNLFEAIKKMGFKEMTPIQEVTYPVIFAGQDLCALAETGSGKTAACAIPLIQKVDTAHNAIQGLVIVPTRELCIQYVDEIQKIAAMTDLAPFAVYGGFDRDIQIAKLKHKVHILVATPGRLIDLLYEGVVDLSHVKCAILDEADELLKVGFLEDIEFIMSCILHEHQTLLFAATMADDIKKLAHDCLRDPRHISLIETQAAPQSIEHYFAYLPQERKQAELIKYLTVEKVEQAIIFCNARHKVDTLFRNMRKDFKDAEYIHAGLSQDKRTSIFRQFKKKKVRYLIATDVAGRGLDFSHVSHIINWDFPRYGEQYTHRTGRSGRMGKKGKAFTFVTGHDLPNLRKLIIKNKISPRWIGKDPLQKNNMPRGRKTQKGKRA